jgi:hypothetical protein
MSTQRQGSLNRLRGHVVFNEMAQLTVKPSDLGPEGIRLALDNNATDLLPTMTGMVPSPRPYQECTLTVSIVKSMSKGWIYKNQLAYATIVGTIVVWPDVETGDDLYGNPATDIGTFTIEGAALETFREMSFAGNEATFTVTFKGYIQVNQVYFNGMT